MNKEGEPPIDRLGLSVPSERNSKPQAEAPADLEAFVAGLRRDKEQLLPKLEELVRKPHKTLDELAQAIYLDAALKLHVFRINPFRRRGASDAEVQADREVIAFLAAERVARRWITDHPESEAAGVVLQNGIYAHPTSHHALLREMWYSISLESPSDSRQGLNRPLT